MAEAIYWLQNAAAGVREEFHSLLTRTPTPTPV